MFLFAKEGDADSKIASTALELAKENQVVVVADDTDVAVMQLCCYITGNRHFMPKSGHSNERVFCIRFDRALKMQFNEGSPHLPTTNRSQVMTVFLKPILHFFGQKKMHKYKKIFNNFSSQNEDFQSLKSNKNDSLLYNGHKTDVKYISSKLQVGNFYFLPNTLKY